MSRSRPPTGLHPGRRPGARAFWAVRHEHRRHLYLAGSFRPSLWTSREEEAERFPTEHLARNAILVQLHGRGHPVLLAAPNEFAVES